MKKGLTELVFILDKSGSMGGLEKDTIGGYNAFLLKQKEVEGECFITTVLFNHSNELLHDRIDLRAVKAITTSDYVVGGSTALMDAMGMAIQKVISVQKNTTEEYRAENVLFVIITDGEENASKKFGAQQIKDLVNTQKKKGWEFIFLGANIDAVETAAQYGIDAPNVADYLADSQGTTNNFEGVSKAVGSMRVKGSLDLEALEVIRQDTKKRK